MEKFLMFWALMNFAISMANAVNMRKLRQLEKALYEDAEETEADA